MTTKLDIKRTLIFLAFAFGIAWAAAVVLWQTGGLSSPYAFILVSVAYMGAPALANVFTRLITREGWHNTWLKPNITKSWRWWLLAWFGPAVLIAIGMLVYYLLFPQYYDPSMSYVTKLLEQQAAAYNVEVPTMSPVVVLITQSLQALLIAPIINALFTFGEEFGWRAYLLQKLLPLGGRKAVLALGVIWGIWHAPIIAMGHNYGLEYGGAPWLGILAMTWFTITLGTIIAWTVLKARSVWPAVIIHGAVNGTAGIVMFFTKGEPNLLLGPAISGVIGGIALTVVALIIFFSRHGLDAPTEEATKPAADVLPVA